MTKEATKEMAMVTSPSALQSMAQRLSLTKEGLEKVLKATAFNSCKTNEEFVMAIVVANTYNLNPLLKEIYAFPAKGGVIPIVSTDGWTKLMVNHPDYAAHYFKDSDEMKTMEGAKPCPEWMEIHIVKKNGKEVIIKEYLDEVFRKLSYVNPWQTHTKRMLRHKTKIQGAREAFGFGGIYDKDEGDRIIEAQATVVRPGKPEVATPKALPPKGAAITPPKRNPNAKITVAQRQLIFIKAKNYKITEEKVREVMVKNFDTNTSENLTNAQLDELFDWMTAYAEIIAKETKNG